MTDTIHVAWPGPDELEDRLGNCYTLTLQFAMNNDLRNLAVVHGLIHPARSEQYRGDPAAPPTFLHAWIEADGVIYDPVTRVAALTTDYTRTFGAERIALYPRAVAFDLAMTVGHDGPYDQRSLRIAQTPPAERIF